MFIYVNEDQPRQYYYLFLNSKDAIISGILMEAIQRSNKKERKRSERMKAKKPESIDLL